MIYKLNTPCKSGDILQELRLTPIQSECTITSVANIDSIQVGSLAFWSGEPSKFESLARRNSQGAMIFIEALPKTHNNNTYIVVANPRLAFIKALQYLEGTKGFEQNINHSISVCAQVHETAVIEEGVHIGAGSTIGSHAHIFRGVSIGENCIISNGASIGKSGFSFERDEQGNPRHFPHLGAVKIGNNVEIGANTCISKGVLQDTIIENHVKIDDLVYLAHNCHIGEQSMIISGATLCGGVTVGKKTWIGASASIRQNLSVGDNATVGFGAVVTKDIAANIIVAGNPASIMEQQH